jgi:hypothetical protein
MKTYLYIGVLANIQSNGSLFIKLSSIVRENEDSSVAFETIRDQVPFFPTIDALKVRNEKNILPFNKWEDEK